jgi:hypothetical protein
VSPEDWSDTEISKLAEYRDWLRVIDVLRFARCCLRPKEIDEGVITEKLKDSLKEYQEQVAADDSATLNTKRALRESEEKIAETRQKVVEMEAAMAKNLETVTNKQNEILEMLQKILEK